MFEEFSHCNYCVYRIRFCDCEFCVGETDLGKMAGESGSTGVVDDGGASSPRNKIKFLCSHGGKILPKAGDGSLKYVGGETRVIAVPRDITFKGIHCWFSLFPLNLSSFYYHKSQCLSSWRGSNYT